MEKKHLSTFANDVIGRCARKLDTSFDSLVEEFEREWEPESGHYSRKLVEFCSSKALTVACGAIGETISNGSFSRATFDMMLAWEMPTSAEQESIMECAAKEKEEKKVLVNDNPIQDEVPLFYSDILTLLVDQEPTVGEDAFFWLAKLVPLAADTVNGRFTFETLTAPTANRLHFPGYDKFFKEIQGCVKHLQKQEIPKGVVLADDEFILHVEGTLSSQRVIRHIGGTSWPDMLLFLCILYKESKKWLTLTNYAVYFEASSVLYYEDAIKFDLSKDIEHSVKPVATGPWGAPLFDKAVLYESSELQEGVVLEFPEITSSTRRDHWLALIKEIMLLHKFLLKFKVSSPLEVWEIHARTILGIIRLHAAREMLRFSPPEPKSFLTFALMDELPKGDYVLRELAESLKNFTTGQPSSASSILRNLSVSQQSIPVKPEQIIGDQELVQQPENLSSLENALNQSREEAKEVGIVKATVEGLREEGICKSAQILMGLLRPLGSVVPSTRKILEWEQPFLTSAVIFTTLGVDRKCISAFLLWMVANMLLARWKRIPERLEKVVIFKDSNQSTIVENLVSAQHGLQTAHRVMQKTNIALLKVWSILVSKAPKHTNIVMMVMAFCAITLAVIPFKFVLMGATLYIFLSTSKLRKRMQSEEGDRRLREWWDSIPVMSVEVVENK